MNRGWNAARVILGIALVLLALRFSFDHAHGDDGLQAARDALIADVRSYARRHVELDAPMQTDLVVRLFADNVAGVSSKEVASLYEEEFLARRRRTFGLWRNAVWLTAVAVSFLLFLAHRAVVKQIDIVAGRARERAVRAFAGRRAFRRLALKHYRAAILRKHEFVYVPFRPGRPLSIREILVPVTADCDSRNVSRDAQAFVAQTARLVVLGQPGAGKTMLLRQTALRFADEKLKTSIPVFLELHRLMGSKSDLETELTLQLEREGFPNPRPFLRLSLEKGTACLLLDGLDEVRQDERPRVVRQLTDLVEKYPKVRAVVTCRDAVYKQELVEAGFVSIRMRPFSDHQIRRFLKAWAPYMPREKSVEQLSETLRARPKIMVLARNPLLLTIIAYLYTDTAHELPHSRVEFYDLAIDVLLSQWHQVLNHYQASDKRLVLQRLALALHERRAVKAGDGRSATQPGVIATMKQTLDELGLHPTQDALPLLDEVVERSGLLLRIEGGKRYQFIHSALQEYLTAAELQEAPTPLLSQYFREPDHWREILKLWCGMGLDCTAVVRAVYEKEPETALACLADAHRVSPDVAQEIVDELKGELGKGEGNREVVRAFADMASDRRQRGRSVLGFLQEALARGNDERCRSAAALALAFTNLPEAAKTLAKHLHSRPVCKDALVRMGDVAVPELAVRAAEGDRDALDMLQAIATPQAAQTLISLLWDSSEDLSHAAAWRLAALLNATDLEDSLSDYPLGEEQCKSPTAPELTRYFRQFTTTSYYVIVDRIAHLLAEAPLETAPLDPPKLDVRLVAFLLDHGCSAESTLSQSVLNHPPQALVSVLDKINNLNPRGRFVHSWGKEEIGETIRFALASGRVLVEEDPDLAIRETSGTDLRATLLHELVAAVGAESPMAYYLRCVYTDDALEMLRERLGVHTPSTEARRCGASTYRFDPLEVAEVCLALLTSVLFLLALGTVAWPVFAGPDLGPRQVIWLAVTALYLLIGIACLALFFRAFRTTDVVGFEDTSLGLLCIAILSPVLAPMALAIALIIIVFSIVEEIGEVMGVLDGSSFLIEEGLEMLVVSILLAWPGATVYLASRAILTVLPLGAPVLVWALWLVLAAVVALVRENRDFGP